MRVGLQFSGCAEASDWDAPAGTDSMSALDGRIAVPPGTYTPTAPARSIKRLITLSRQAAGSWMTAQQIHATTSW